jgi:integrase
LENRVALRREGLIDPKAEVYRNHEARPLSEHLDAWRDNLLHGGCTLKHADQTADQVRRLVAVMFGARPDDIDGRTLKGDGEVAKRDRQLQAREAIGRLVMKARLSDIAAERVQAALATFRHSGRSAETCNHYRTAVRTFARWCKRTGRLRESPLDDLAGYNAKEDPRHDRRTLSLEELHRLILAAECGSTVKGLSGPVRALCYRLAASTGLRYSEIRSIRPGSFNWGAAPSVTIRAAYTKNGDPATLNLPADLVGDLKSYVATLPVDACVFPLPRNTRGAAILRVDLAAAGIPYRDASGQVFDFHALRCEMATLADAAGVTPRVVQRLMRHSSLELTGRYTKPRAVDIEAAASLLPSLKPVGDRPEVMVMTGTDPAPVRGRIATSGATDAGGDETNSLGGKELASDGYPTNAPIPL